MSFSLLIPLGLNNTRHERRLLEWWAEGGFTLWDEIEGITKSAASAGCSEIVLALPFGTPLTGRQESDQIRRLPSGLVHSARFSLEVFIEVIRKRKMRATLYTGIGWPNRPWSPFGWRYGVPSKGPDGTYDWRLPTIRSLMDRRAVIADLQAAKDIGFDAVWIDQLAQVDAERPGEGGLWARYIRAETGLMVAGEAHWDDDLTTDMVSLGREIDQRVTLTRFGNLARDIAWINGHTTIDGKPDGPPVRSPADQVEAAKRFRAMGFEVCYEAHSAEYARGLVEAMGNTKGVA